MSGGNQQKNLTPTTLLEWGIQNQTTKASSSTDNSTSDEPPKVDIKKLDPKWIDVILGKKDVVRMKELIDFIQSEETSLSEKINAFDELEMLLESLDNANDLRPSGLWPSLFELLNHLEPKIREYSAWCIGTSIQNNEKSQKDLIDLGGLKIILDRLLKEKDLCTLTKLMRCVSGLLKQNPDAFKVFYSENGFDVLGKIMDRSIQNDYPSISWKVSFFLSSLIRDAVPKVSKASSMAIYKSDLPDKVIQSLTKYLDDEDVYEKGLQFLVVLKKNNLLSESVYQKFKNVQSNASSSSFAKFEKQQEYELIFK